ncbi:hypothetical protein LSTR_LSTR017142, partial [Laodelphax striatellus]
CRLVLHSRSCRIRRCHLAISWRPLHLCLPNPPSRLNRHPWVWLQSQITMNHQQRK